MAQPIRIYFLGGLGEIGRNCMVIEQQEKLLLIDCGLMFPSADMHGIDLVLADFTFLRENADRIVGCVATHGHEDHVGGLQFLLRELSFPLFGSALTLGLARNRIEEAGLSRQTEFIAVTDGERRKIGPFDVEFLPVTHSVPHAHAIVLHTPQGVIIHSGDFKLDLTPVDNRRTNLSRLGELAMSDGVRLLMCDSTNAEEAGHAPSEKNVGKVLKQLFIEHADRRIITASFASHIHRIQQIIEAAVDQGRVVATLGRSMQKNVRLAIDLKLLNVKASSIIDIDDARDLAPEKVCIISTGSQGEPLAALSRMANGDHQIRVGEGDTVILASSLIPGNENSVFRIINELTRFGAKVVHKGNAMVHVSGHAAAGELTYCYNIVKPKYVMPVHGEWRHLRANAELAIATGVPRKNTIVIENGIVVDLIDHEAQVVGSVPCGFVYVDGQSIGDITEDSLKDRRILGEEGFISVVVVIDAQSGKIVAGPDIHARGFNEDESLFDGVKLEIEKALTRAVADGINGTHQLSQVVRRTIGSWVGGKHRRRPMIVPVVIEV